MAMDMFMDITGPVVKGESQDSKMKDKIDVLSWSWGAANSGTVHTGSGSGGGKADFQDLSFTKWIDASTGVLLTGLAKGTHFDQAVLTVRKAGDMQQVYLTITMKKVLVASVSTGGSGGEDRLTENVTLNFGAVEVAYKIQGAKGATTDGPKFTWNIATNKDSLT